MRFRNYYDKFHSPAMEDPFEYLEFTKIIVPGHYGVLKYIFANDRKALRKIDAAARKIQSSTPRGKSSISRNEGEFLIINVLIIYQKGA